MSSANGMAPDAGPAAAPVPARFQVIAELGRGGMGVVHEVRDERGATMALKGLRNLRPREILRIKDEFRALRDMQHPNLCRLGELFEDGGRWFYTMELVPGTDVLRWVRADEAARRTPSPVAPRSLSVGDLQRSTASLVTDSDLDAPTSTVAPRSADELSSVTDVTGSDGDGDGGAWVDPAPVLPAHQRAAPGFDEDRLRAALRGIARGLSALHRADLVHRDVKPSNIRVDPAGRVVILDFGVVAAIGRPDAEVVGTPAYMAPEQARGEASPAVDWYAVGVLLYRMLTGHLPFPATRDGLRLRGHRLPPSPDGLVRDLPPDLVGLCMRLLEPEPSLRGGEADVGTVVGELDAAPIAGDGPWWRAGPGVTFVGRDDELGHLRTAAAAAGPRAVVVTGTSGMGKTALVHHALRAITRAVPATVVLHGRCDQRELVPYNALDSVVDDLARRLAREPALLAARPAGWDDLVRLFPVLATALADAPAAPAHRDVDRERAAAALAEALTALAAHAPVIVFIDDLHWADADSTALLRELFDGDRAPPVLLLATARGDASAVPAVRALTVPVDELALRGLEDTDVRRLVDAATGGAVDAAAIARGAGGHPMFVAELARFAAERRAAAGNLEEALWERARDLAAPARQLLAAIVTAGAPIEIDAAAAAAEVAPTVAAGALHALRAARLVRAARQRDRDVVEPYHDRVAAAVTDHLASGDRTALHRRLADVLAGRGAPPEPLAYHLAAAGDRSAAAVHAARAAARAAATFAFERAAEWYAMAQAGDPAEVGDRHALAVARAEMLVRAGRPRDAAVAFLAAAADAPGDDDAMDLRRRAFEQYFKGGYLAEGVAIAGDVLAALDLELPRSRGRLIAGLLWDRWRADRTLDWTPATAPLAPRERLRLDACWSATAGLTLVDAVLGAAYSTKLARLCLRAGEPVRIARALAAEAFTTAAFASRGRLARIEAALARTEAGAGATEAAVYRVIASAARAWFADCDWIATTRLAESAAAAWQASGGGLGWEADMLDMFMAWSQAVRGDIGALRRHVLAAVRQAQRTGNRLREVGFRCQFPQVHLAVDRADEAAADVDDAIASWQVPDGLAADDNLFYWSTKARTMIARYRGSDDDRLEADWRRVERSLLMRFPMVVLELAASRGHWRVGLATPAALAGAAADARRIRSTGLAVAPPVACVLEAGIAHARGDAATAVRLLTAALPALDRHVMPGPAAAARRQLGGLVGGDDGRRLVAEADAALAGLGAARPDAIARLWTSGPPP